MTELDQKLAARVTPTKDVTYSDFSACKPPTYLGEQDPFKCHRWIQDVEGAFATSKCPEERREIYKVTEFEKESEPEPQEEPKISHYVALYVPSIPFPGCLGKHKEATLVYRTIESLKELKINCPLVKFIKNKPNYAKHMNNFVSNKPRIEEGEAVKVNARCSASLQN
ncbi:hypothetical protein CTI12_AA092460 [Artemisia annua]|uniref:Uncharacterized protein n=1 Tax=Artemisia annua TaxID=35608 RepID=A0A2U1PZA0_ARTAN|nr:hypothetical protein CTI12_AA092460 [Artemisia annua]